MSNITLREFTNGGPMDGATEKLPEDQEEYIYPEDRKLDPPPGKYILDTVTKNMVWTPLEPSFS